MDDNTDTEQAVEYRIFGEGGITNSEGTHSTAKQIAKKTPQQKNIII